MEPSPSWKAWSLNWSIKPLSVIESRSSLPHSLQTAIYACIGPDQFSPRPPKPISLRYLLILSSRRRMFLPSGLFPSGIATKTRNASLLFPYAAHAFDEEYKS